jgi:uncharacterized membrane protein YkoI
MTDSTSFEVEMALNLYHACAKELVAARNNSAEMQSKMTEMKSLGEAYEARKHEHTAAEVVSTKTNVKAGVKAAMEYGRAQDAEEEVKAEQIALQAANDASMAAAMEKCRLATAKRAALPKPSCFNF